MRPPSPPWTGGSPPPCTRLENHMPVPDMACNALPCPLLFPLLYPLHANPARLLGTVTHCRLASHDLAVRVTHSTPLLPPYPLLTLTCSASSGR